MTKSKTEERSNQLENYIREVVVRKDTRNSNELISFLELYKLASELIYN